MLKKSPGVVFSLFISVGGNDFDNFGEVVIKQQCDGYGISGCATAQLSFSVPYTEYIEKKPKSNAEVMLTIGTGETAKTYVYYVANRQKSGGKVSFVCYDRMAFTDVYVNEEDFSYTDNTISAAELVNTLALMCGIAHVDSLINAMGVFGALPFKKSDIANKTARTLLEEVSKAWCGYFKVTYSNTLYFVPFGFGTVTGNAVTEYTAISEGFEKGPITRVKMDGENGTFYSGDTAADITETLTVNTRFASQELADVLLVRSKNVKYQGWSCSKAIITGDVLPDITADIAFKDDNSLSRFANNMALSFTSCGIFFSGGSNAVTENEFEYMGILSRKIEERIKDGEQLGNRTMLTRYQGLIHLAAENSTTTLSEGTSAVTSYGYSPADENGVITFDGALTNKIVPSSAVINDDMSEVIIAYGNKKYRYNIIWDGDNISEFTKEEVKE